MKSGSFVRENWFMSSSFKDSTISINMILTGISHCRKSGTLYFDKKQALAYLSTNHPQHPLLLKYMAEL